MKPQKQKFIIFNGFFAIIAGLLLAVNLVANHWDQALVLYFGKIGADSSVYVSQYGSDEELRIAQEKCVTDIVDEGSVLLKNEGALPLVGNEKITVYGQSSVDWANGAIGSTAMNVNLNMTLAQSLTNAGFAVNEEVWNYYKNSNKAAGPGGSGQSSDWKLNETSFDYLNEHYSASMSEYSDAALVVISRIGCEGGDLPREMSRYDGLASEHYLELSTVEKNILKGVKRMGYKKTILLLKSSFMLDADFLDDPECGVDAMLIVGSTGNNGIEEIGKMLAGTVNPSGHLPNTVVYDNMSSPAMQNLGDFRYVDSDGKLVSPKYNYVNYGESIYVGYKYYETRYEDKVMGRGNAGSFDYKSEVKYPFGYGNSYTSFEYSDVSMSVKGETATVSVTVKNTGNVPGCDAIQIYTQSPYTDYDKANLVEKSAVNLSSFGKTDYIEPGHSETYKISFDIVDAIKSYDYKQARGYIIEEGTYYVSVGEDCHDALNNILAKKGYGLNDGMTAKGNSANAIKYEVESTKVFTKDEITDYPVTNRFDDAMLDDAVYLSRQNWSVMENNGLRYATGTMEGISYTTDPEGSIYTHVADAELITNLKNINYKSTGRPKETFDSTVAIVENQKDIPFANMKGVPYDDPRWDEFVQQMSVGEMHKLYNTAGYGTKAVDSVSLPSTFCFDGGIGLVNYVSDWQAYAYPYTTMLACSFNKGLAERMGSLIAEDAMRWNVAGWYAPAMNIHRTPFSGRNFDYYSEDPILSGYIGAYEVKGAQDKGLMAFIKHFAVNDQETERSNCSNWLTEQSLREIYLKPFEISVKVGGAHGLMASMNRIGYRYTRGSYALITEVLRNEWGFQGATITDFTASNKEYSDMALAAGIDLQLDTSANVLTTTKTEEIRHDLQRAAKNTCFMIANSLIMNAFVDGNTKINEGYPVYKIMLAGMDSAVVLACLAEEAVLVTGWIKKNKAEKLLGDN